MSDPAKRLQPVDLQSDAVYRRYRIHVAQLTSGAHVVAVVRFGVPGSGVENLRGDYGTRDEAILAAKRHIDEADTMDAQVDR